MNRIPKGISQHPGVLDVDLDNDWDQTGYRADVILKEDWHFAGEDDNAPYWDKYSKRRTGFFATLREFLDAKPTQYTPDQLLESKPQDQ